MSRVRKNTSAPASPDPPIGLFREEALARLRRAAYVIASRLLAYPDDQLLAELPLIKSVSSRLPPNVRQRLDLYFDAITDRPLLRLQAEYVSTFDLKRRCCLYLTYYLNGDTRRRGNALWRFQETYRWADWKVTGGELPDYLPALLEFAATSPDAESAALSLLDEHRHGLEVLRAALARFRAPQEHVIAALFEMLPELSPAQAAAAALLVAQGPPAESVGLEPFNPFNLTDITIGARS